MKEILLDTHTFIWWVDNSPRLSKKAKKTIADLDNACYFSLVSSWEMAVKCSIGKLELAIPLREYIPQHMAVNSFKQLPISFQHVSRVETLPLHHRDPFDRLLAAQAMLEKLVIVSADESFDLYGVQRVW